MNKNGNPMSRRIGMLMLAAGMITGLARAEVQDKAIQDKIDARVKLIKELAADPAIVAAVKEHNAKLSDDAAAMTQEKWKGLSVLDPFVRSLTKNTAATTIKSKKDDIMTEAFLSGTDGKKVAFLSKPSNWSHSGKPKHDKPMAGETWQGSIEVDESTGAQQIQVAVPVLDGDKVIGSLVVGLNITKLKD